MFEKTSSSPEAEQQQVVFTPASTVDELIKTAFFVATSIDAPVVDAVSPRQLNLHYPADGSLVSIRIEGRPGAWGGIGPILTDQAQIDEANAHYDEMLAASLPPPPDIPLAREAHENPTYEVQRQE